MISIQLRGQEEIIKHLRGYARGLEDKLRNVVERLMDEGFEVCDSGFANAIYDGDNDVLVGRPMWVSRTRMEIAVTGTRVAFIEFGTGIVWPDDHPRAAEMGAIRGAYGYHQGMKTSWHYHGLPGTYGTYDSDKDRENNNVRTHGNPANMAMWNAAMRMRDDALDIAREEFGK